MTVAAGLSAPIIPHALVSNYGIGPNIGFGLGYELTPILELEPRVFFSSFPHKDDESFKAFLEQELSGYPEHVVSFAEVPIVAVR